MSFLLRKKKNQVAPALQSKLDSLPSSSTSNGHAATPSKPTLPSPLPNAPRILIIGAGSRGNAYAKPVKLSGLARTVAVCEPDAFKRKDFGEKYIWGLEKRPAKAHEEFSDWSDFVKYEQTRRERVSAGELKEADDEYKGVDGVFVCVLDELHVHVVKALAPLGLHVMCEKPLATTLDDCISMYGAVTKEWELLGKKTIFSICHVLRYSPHNILLRKLVRDDKVAGDIISVEHTEPIGWWHYTHSYVRYDFSLPFWIHSGSNHAYGTEATGVANLLLHHHSLPSHAMTLIFFFGSFARHRQIQQVLHTCLRQSFRREA
jgi:predicted dehydrogenase